MARNRAGTRNVGTNTATPEVDRTVAPAGPPAVANEFPTTAPMAITAWGPPAPNMTERFGAMPGTVTGWQADNPLASDTAQIGAFRGSVLTQYPTNLPNVQRWCGVESLRSAWYYPAVHGLPLGSSITQTVSPANAVGSQRFGHKYTGPIGPLLARTFSAKTTDQQMRESGARVVGWARSLWNGFAGQSHDTPADQNTWPSAAINVRNTPLPVVALTPTATARPGRLARGIQQR